MQELLIQLWKEQQSTVFLVTHSVEEAVYLGDRVFRMAAKPGRLVEELQVPRPDEPPEVTGASPGSSISARNCCAGWRRNPGGGGESVTAWTSKRPTIIASF